MLLSRELSSTKPILVGLKMASCITHVSLPWHISTKMYAHIASICMIPISGFISGGQGMPEIDPPPMESGFWNPYINIYGVAPLGFVLASSS